MCDFIEGSPKSKAFGDIVTMGELLIDFTPSGEMNGQKLYMQNAGGAVANVAAALSGFGVSASFLGMVGKDFFGRYLEGVLREKGVDTSGLVLSGEYLTTLAFVHLSANGERDFTFYRKPGADTMYDISHLGLEKIKRAKVFHFGSLSMTDEPIRSSTFRALDAAKGNGVIISFDPNYRAPLWEDKQMARKYILRGIDYTDILKISCDEAALIFGVISYEEAAVKLIERGVKLVFITLGSAGAVYANASGTGKVNAYSAKVADTTGAGDCFMASALYKFLSSGKILRDLSLRDIHEFADFACAAASVCVERMGGIPSMPSLEEVNQRLNTSLDTVPAVDNNV